MTLKTRIALIAGTAILIATIGGIQTFDMSNNAFAEGPIPKWIKKTAVYWASSPEVSDTVYLDAMAWLINNGIMVVDTATAVESAGPIDKRIASLDVDIGKLEKRIDKLESSSDSFSSSSSKDEFHYRIFEPHYIGDCDMGFMGMFVYGWCPDGDKRQFDVEMPKEAMDAEAAIVWAVSSEPPFSAGCEVYMIGTDDAGRTSALVTCLTAPAEGTPMTMLVIDVHGGEGYEELMSMATAPEP
tara:strand:+ start:3817 stop:4542 length:726 start_codon:yes stop_codon:yes gene_type:complete